MQPERNGRGLSVRHDGPRQPLIRRREVLRHGDDEHAPAPARKKMRRLAHVWASGLDPIIGPDGDVQSLRRVPIEIADKKAAAAVWILEPAFERAGDAAPELPRRLAGQL